MTPTLKMLTLTPSWLRKLGKRHGWNDVIAAADAWEAQMADATASNHEIASAHWALCKRLEAERIARHMEAAQFLSQIAAWKASCKDAEKRLEAAEKAVVEAKGLLGSAREGSRVWEHRRWDWFAALAKEEK